MFETGPIGIDVHAPVTAHPTISSLRESLGDLFRVHWAPSDLSKTDFRLNTADIFQSDQSGTVIKIERDLDASREARRVFATQRISADSECATREHQSLEAYLAICDTLSTAVKDAVECASRGDHSAASRLVNEAWKQIELLERTWLNTEFEQILNDPLANMNLPEDPYRWVIGIPEKQNEPGTKGLRFEQLQALQKQAEEDAAGLQRNISDFSKKIRQPNATLALAELKEFTELLAQAAYKLAEFLPHQCERIAIYRQQLIRDLPRIDNLGVDPVIYVFANDVCTLKESAVQKLGLDLSTLMAVGSDLERVQVREVQLEYLSELEFLGVSIAARVRLSDPLFLGTQRSYDNRGPVDPHFIALALEARPLQADSTFLDLWPGGALGSVIDSRLPPGSINVAVRGAGYGTREEGVLWPIYLDVAAGMLCGGDDLAGLSLVSEVGASRLRGVVPITTGGYLEVRQHEGGIVQEWKIDPNRPKPGQEVESQMALLQEHARLELNAKGTSLGEHKVLERLAIAGATFVTLEDGEGREFGFSYMFVEPEYFPDREDIAAIPRELLPDGRPARPNLIVISDEVARIVENGAAYTMLMQTLEQIAREAGCDYMIARVNLHEGSRGWLAAERRGWRKIPAFTSTQGSIAGRPTQIDQQWIVKELYPNF